MDAPVAIKDSTGAAGVPLKEQLNAKKKMMNELASKNDFTGAAVAQEAMKELEAIAEKLRAKNTMMAELAAKGDYTEAAAVLEEIKAMEVHLMAFHPERLACEVVAASAELTKPVGLLEQQLQLEEQLSAARTMVDELAAKLDFAGAVEAQAKAAELEKCLSALGSSDTPAGPAKLTRSELIEEQIRSKTHIMSEVPSKNDFVGAAAAHAEINEVKAYEEQPTAASAELTKPARLLEQQLQAQKLHTQKKILDAPVAMKDFAGAAGVLLEEQLNAKKKMMNELASMKDL